MHGSTGGTGRIAVVARGLLGGLLAVGAMSTAQAAQAVLHKQVQVRHYIITGGDELTLLREMRRKGPRVGGRPALASTRLQAHYSATLAGRGGTCRVRSFVIRAQYTMTLPRLAAAGGVRPATRKRWPRFVAKLRRHENRHVRIWQDCLQQARRQLPALRAPSCSQLKLRLREAYRRIMTQCSARHDVFDRREKHAAASLPFIKAAFGMARRQHLRRASHATSRTRAVRAVSRRVGRSGGSSGKARRNWR